MGFKRSQVQVLSPRIKLEEILEEKRKGVRVARAIVLQYAQNTSEPLHWDSTSIKDISTEGLLFNSNKVFAKNEILQLRFTLPTDPLNRLEVASEVVDSFLYGHGTRVKFTNLGADDKKTISDYVQYQLEIINKSKR
jgi:hypothetical protein